MKLGTKAKKRSDSSQTLPLNKRGREKYIPWLILGLTYVTVLAVQYVYMRHCLDSDMASEMVLADLLNKEGKFLSTNWYYSTELRVFCEQIFFKLGLGLFPTHWRLARLTAQALLMAVMTGAFLFCAKELRLGKWGIYGAAALLCPFGYWYTFHCIFGGFYMVHIFFTVLILGMSFAVYRDTENDAGKKKKRLPVGNIHLILLLLICFCAGLNGLRILLNFFAPFLAVSFWLYGKASHREGRFPGRGAKEARLLLIAVVGTVGAFAGCGINRGILSKIYHFETTRREWTSLDLSALLQTWSDLLSLFGYPMDRFWKVENEAYSSHPVDLISPQGVLSAFSLVLIGALLFCIYRLWKRRLQLSFLEQVTAALLPACVLINGIVFSWMDGRGGENASYWIPVVSVCFLVIAIEGKTENYRLRNGEKLVTIAFLVTMLCCSLETMMHFVSYPPRAPEGIEQVADWLEEAGYTKGCATFWNANVVTELTNGNLELWDVDAQTLTTHKWLQETAHDAMPEGTFFLLVDRDERETFRYLQESGIEPVYEDGYFWQIYVFESWDELMSLKPEAAV